MFSKRRVESSPLAPKVQAAMERGSYAITVYNRIGKGQTVTPELLKAAGIRQTKPRRK